MLRYRPFRNTDPPNLVAIWRTQTDRPGLVLPVSVDVLEQLVLCKQYFDPKGLVLAEDEGHAVGFAHAGFGPTDGEDGISTELGVVCLVLVRPECGQAEVTDGLIAQCEAYLQRRGSRVLYGGVAPENVPQLLQAYYERGELSPEFAVAVMDGPAADGIPAFEQHPMLAGQRRIVLRNCGVIDPENMEHYIARGGYSALAKALRMSPEQVIEEVKASGLRGRGGAGFPTGRKWEFCRNSNGDRRYMICNADEGDPGAFMDRSVLEANPHAVLEGMIIAAFAVGARHGYVYVRHEYQFAVERLRWALTHRAQTRQAVHGLGLAVGQYDWKAMAPQYDAVMESLMDSSS